MGRTSANNRTVNDFSVASGACQTPFQRTFSIQIDQNEKTIVSAFERSPLLALASYERPQIGKNKFPICLFRPAKRP